MVYPRLCPKAHETEGESHFETPRKILLTAVRPREYKRIAHGLTMNQLQALQDGCGSLTADPLTAPILPPLSATPVLSWPLQKWSLQHLSVSSRSLEAQAKSENYRITMSDEGSQPGPPFWLHENMQKAGMRALKPKFKLHLTFCVSFLPHVCFFLLREMIIK